MRFWDYSAGGDVSDLSRRFRVRFGFGPVAYAAGKLQIIWIIRSTVFHCENVIPLPLFSANLASADCSFGLAPP